MSMGIAMTIIQNKIHPIRSECKVGNDDIRLYKSLVPHEALR